MERELRDYIKKDSDFIETLKGLNDYSKGVSESELIQLNTELNTLNNKSLSHGLISDKIKEIKNNINKIKQVV